MRSLGLSVLPVLAVIALIGLLIAVGVALAARARHDSWMRASQKAARWIVITSLIVISAATLVAGGRYSTEPNLTPFASIAGQMHNTDGDLGLWNLAGNVALYVPLGLSAAWARARWRDGILLGVITSLVIELIQYGARLGAPDIDDVILNTAGALIGSAFAVGTLWILKQRAGTRQLSPF